MPVIHTISRMQCYRTLSLVDIMTTQVEMELLARPWTMSVKAKARKEKMRERRVRRKKQVRMYLMQCGIFLLFFGLTRCHREGNAD